MLKQSTLAIEVKKPNLFERRVLARKLAKRKAARARFLRFCARSIQPALTMARRTKFLRYQVAYSRLRGSFATRNHVNTNLNTIRRVGIAHRKATRAMLLRKRLWPARQYSVFSVRRRALNLRIRLRHRLSARVLRGALKRYRFVLRASRRMRTLQPQRVKSRCVNLYAATRALRRDSRVAKLALKATQGRTNRLLVSRGLCSPYERNIISLPSLAYLGGRVSRRFLTRIAKKEIVQVKKLFFGNKKLRGLRRWRAFKHFRNITLQLIAVQQRRLLRRRSSGKLEFYRTRCKLLKSYRTQQKHLKLKGRKQSRTNRKYKRKYNHRRSNLRQFQENRRHVRPSTPLETHVTRQRLKRRLQFLVRPLAVLRLYFPRAVLSKLQQARYDKHQAILTINPRVRTRWVAIQRRRRINRRFLYRLPSNRRLRKSRTRKLFRRSHAKTRNWLTVVTQMSGRFALHATSPAATLKLKKNYTRQRTLLLTAAAFRVRRALCRVARRRTRQSHQRLQWLTRSSTRQAKRARWLRFFERRCPRPLIKELRRRGRAWSRWKRAPRKFLSFKAGVYRQLLKQRVISFTKYTPWTHHERDRRYTAQYRSKRSSSWASSYPQRGAILQPRREALLSGHTRRRTTRLVSALVKQSKRLRALVYRNLQNHRRHIISVRHQRTRKSQRRTNRARRQLLRQFTFFYYRQRTSRVQLYARKSRRWRRHGVQPLPCRRLPAVLRLNPVYSHRIRFPQARAGLHEALTRRAVLRRYKLPTKSYANFGTRRCTRGFHEQQLAAVRRPPMCKNLRRARHTRRHTNRSRRVKYHRRLRHTHAYVFDRVAFQQRREEDLKAESFWYLKSSVQPVINNKVCRGIQLLAQGYFAAVINIKNILDDNYSRGIVSGKSVAAVPQQNSHKLASRALGPVLSPAEPLLRSVFVENLVVKKTDSASLTTKKTLLVAISRGYQYPHDRRLLAGVFGCTPAVAWSPKTAIRCENIALVVMIIYLYNLYAGSFDYTYRQGDEDHWWYSDWRNGDTRGWAKVAIFMTILVYIIDGY